MRYRLDQHFEQWAAKREVQAQARAFLCSRIEDGDKLVAALELEPIGTRLMNFKVIQAMNALFWSCDKQLDEAVAFNRGDWNALAMQPAPQWRKVMPMFAYALGFRPEGEHAAPTGTPQLLPD